MTTVLLKPKLYDDIFCTTLETDIYGYLRMTTVAGTKVIRQHILHDESNGYLRIKTEDNRFAETKVL